MAPIDQEAQPATVSQSPLPAGKIRQDKVALKKLRRRARKIVSRRRLLPGPLNPQQGHLYPEMLRGIVSYFTTVPNIRAAMRGAAFDRSADHPE
jgi:hypothetical protein